MADWISKTLGEVTSFITKGIPPKYTEKESKNTIRVLNQKCNRNFEISYDESRLHDVGLKKVPENKYLQPGDVLINSTGTGTAGRVAQIFDVPVPTTIDGHMILIRPTKEIDFLYYGYAVKGNQKVIETLAEGSTGQTEVNRQRLQDEIVIKFPKDKELQKEIGTLLFLIDEKIRNNNEINNNLELQMTAIYKNRFSYVLRGNSATVGQLIIFSNGKKRPNEEGNIPVYGGNGILAYTNKFNSNNCIVIGRVGAYCGNVSYSPKECWVSDNAIIARQKNSNSQLFAYHLLKNAKLPSRHIGSGQPLMTQGILNAIPCSLPDSTEIDAFNDLCEPLQRKIDDNFVENIRLSALRKKLLPKLISGELDVSDINL